MRENFVMKISKVLQSRIIKTFENLQQGTYYTVKKPPKTGVSNHVWQRVKIVFVDLHAGHTCEHHKRSFYSKTNQMHNISNVFYFRTTLYMFRTVFPSIIRSPRLYIQHQVYVIQVLWLLASGNEMEHLGPASKQPHNLFDIYLMLYVVLDS